jgi:YidC/Oxa1 family membrane protein insertase
MWLVYSAVGNYSLALVIFTVITRVLLFPLSLKQQRSTASMSALQPKLEKLKKQYGNNQPRLQEEQMRLYREEGVNPMASCLPLLIQMPILFGIIDVVYRPLTHILRLNKDVMGQATEVARQVFGEARYFEQRPELYILQAFNRAAANIEAGAPDAALAAVYSGFEAIPGFIDKVSDFHNTLFGFIDLGQTPSFTPDVWDAAAVGMIVIAFSSGVLNLIQTIYTQRRAKKTNPAAANNPAMKSMNIMLYGMPVFSVWIATTFPAGIGFYWAVSALLALFQSLILNKIYTPEYVALLAERDREKNKEKQKKRPGMMQRYQALIEEQNARNAALEKTLNKNKLIIAEESGAGREGEADGASPAGGGMGEGEGEGEGRKTAGEGKLSKSKQKDYERRIIAEARRRMAEKYGDDYTED